MIYCLQKRVALMRYEASVVRHLSKTINEQHQLNRSCFSSMEAKLSEDSLFSQIYKM